jgi:mono/diheme cytochrome c family protein
MQPYGLTDLQTIMNFTLKTMSLTSTKLLLFPVFTAVVFFVVLSRPVLAQEAAGADVYKAKCLTCHAKDGSGNTPVGKSLQSADLRSPEVQKKSDAELTEAISEGKGNMPAFKTMLSEGEIHSVLGYVRTLASKGDSAAKKKSGK